MRKVLLGLALASAMAFTSVSLFAQEAPGTIADIVVASASAETPEFATLLVAVQAADPAVLEALSDPEATLTVFAPTDAAFATLAETLGEEAFAAVLADTELLTDILLFHVVGTEVDSAAVVEGLTSSIDAEVEGDTGAIAVPSLQGQYLDITQDAEGVIYVNGAVLNLEMIDIQASNGIIHVIDAVLLPESRTVADIVVESAGMTEAPEFTLLLAAVQAADPAVLELLSDPEATLTVFAPTDAAFNALGEETLNAVLADQALLTDILSYHVLTTTVRSGDITTMMAEMDPMSMDNEMANGTAATVTVTEEGVFVNDSQVIITDIDASNGVIHVIDAVLLPPTE